MSPFKFPDLGGIPFAERERLWREASEPQGCLAPRMLYLTLIPSMLFSFWVGWALYEFWGALVVGGFGTMFAMYIHGVLRVFVIKRRVLMRWQTDPSNGQSD